MCDAEGDELNVWQFDPFCFLVDVAGGIDVLTKTCELC